MTYRNLPRRQAYNRWRDMVLRCTVSTHKRWKDYGGRGITVCDRWLTFEAYYADTGNRPAPHLTVDRRACGREQARAYRAKRTAVRSPTLETGR